jgi:tetratricopeptide (TPR) repeat protein
MALSKHAALLWLTLLLGAAVEPAQAQVVLPAPVDAVRKQLREGNIEQAIEAGESAVDTLKQDAHAWFWLGRAYAQQAMRAGLLSKPKWAGKTREAYEQAVALDPTHMDARFDLMQYYVMAPGFLGGDADKAQAQAVALRQQDPMMGKLAEAVLAQHDDRPADAERAYRDALALAPDHPRARVSLASFLQQEPPRWEEVEAIWQQALAKNPDDLLAHYQLARAAALTGRGLDAGLAHIDRYIADPGFTSEYTSLAAAHWRRGLILEKLGRRDDALAAYDEAVKLQPTLTGAQEDLERLRDD